MMENPVRKQCTPGQVSDLGHRVLINSRFGVSYSNFSFLTPTFWKGSIEKYGKTPTFSGRQHFYSNFQNPSENPVGLHCMPISLLGVLCI